MINSIEVHNNLPVFFLYALHMLFLEKSEDPLSYSTSGIGTYVYFRPKQSIQKMCVYSFIIQIIFSSLAEFREASNISFL